MQQVSNKTIETLGFNPSEIKRELETYYISMDDKQIEDMLQSLNLKDVKELFAHIGEDVKFNGEIDINEELNYDQLTTHIKNIANKNKIVTNFLGDGLAQTKLSPIVPYVCNIRGLTTAYTPYQPERSQGTLYTLWLYSNAISALTGFEGINASLYERSTCLYEALNTANRIKRKTKVAVVCESIYPNDKEVLDTLQQETDLEIIYAPIDKTTGLTDTEKLKDILEQNKDRISSLSFNQVNGLGLLEDVDELTDIAREYNLITICIFDPMLLASTGLKSPSTFGKDQEGVDIIVGEGQHLCLEANYGGPGLGIFGIRFNEKNKNAIRSTPGRYVGKAKDTDGKDCLCMVLSTREQHIRREKATSNICSNQSFVATIAGAALYEKGDEGLSLANKKARDLSLRFLEGIHGLSGVELYSNSPFYNEIVLKTEKKISVSDDSIIIGKDISGRYGIKENLIKVSFNDTHSEEDLNKLIAFFKREFSENADAKDFIAPDIPETLLNNRKINLPKFSLEELKEYYTKLGDLNVSPDDDIYPLGSCTMKYNPHINDWAAGLKDFTLAHPDMPEKNVQGCLEIIYSIQEDFKAITGLPGVTTQPVAGAQGELVGIKLFQAYHRDKGNKKDLILIPRTAHGTNPATATMAGYETKKIDGKQVGIFTLDCDETGQINLSQLKELIKEEGHRISGIMITNPNTSGVFESNFKEVAQLIHSVDGLVYMDGANMNAIAGIVDLGKLGVDAVHNNLHKTWTIPHGGGGPGDAIVAVSEKLIDFLPGEQIKCEDGVYSTYKAPKSIGSFHRHKGNFAHKVRAYTYIKALGKKGVPRMSEIAVLSANYLYERLRKSFPTLPIGADHTPRMHEFIITLSDETFNKIEKSGTPKAQTIAKLGKLFLDFGLHAPTVAFPEVFGLMIEPTESFTKKELDRFAEVVEAILKIANENPEVLKTTPHFTPVRKVDEVGANRQLILREDIKALPKLNNDLVSPKELRNSEIGKILELILKETTKH